ncbi:hypothetical protein BCY91_10250 [Pelobium manganitolerans]|uniref:Uncharacterized protein n=1 Tax=Pelobium manganitolerans TaxID=1842495 RepID=A0A419S2J2_9SPHI|nr:hypothetical protein [Pelobium manganitolerans]RKD13196.1 hypothetical protein BCY91_10250 [Pelobium manganitolerans]
MMKKQSTASTSGFLMGLMLGFLIGLAMFKETPRSERSEAFPYLVSAGALFCCYAGFKIGAYHDFQSYRDEFLGIKNISTRYRTQDGFWQIESLWQQYPAKEQILITTILDNETVSIFNNLVIANHGFAANGKSAQKLHDETLNDLVQQLKDNFKQSAG